MERREPSVRELFRTASRLASTFVIRAPHVHAHQPVPPASLTAAAGMDRTRSGGSGASGAGLRARQASIDPANTARLQGRDGLSGGAGNVWPTGSRPTTPDDPGV